MKRHEETFLKTEEYKNQGIGTWHLIKVLFCSWFLMRKI